MFYTYVIRSKKDNKWYTGATKDLRKRFRDHNNNKVFSTKGRGLFELIYYEACCNEQDAFAREKYLKSGPGKRFLKRRLKRFLSQTGFTLIESLLYIALFAIIIGGALVAVYQMIESSDSVSAKNIVEMEGSFLLRKIDWALTGASAVDVITPHHLYVEKKENDCVATTTYEFYLNSTEFILKKGCTLPTSSTEYTISSGAVEIEGLDFSKFTVLGKPDGIHASTTIASFDGKHRQTFETTKYLRK